MMTSFASWSSGFAKDELGISQAGRTASGGKARFCINVPISLYLVELL